MGLPELLWTSGEMSLIKWRKVEDFGDSYYLDIGCFKGLTLLKVAVHLTMFWMHMPLFSLAGSILRGSMLSFEVQLSALTIDVTILDFNTLNDKDDNL